MKGRSIFSKLKSGLKILGPGLITGSSDDDPSGIATYSQVGAQFGLRPLWTALFTFPLMVAIQEMCARIGLITSEGLTTTLRNYYPKWMLWTMVIFSFPAIVMNIGADIAGMGAAANLLLPQIPAFVYSILFTLMILAALIFYTYQKVARLLKWACITLLVYFLVPFFCKIVWYSVAKSTLIPTIEWNKTYLSILVAILGTTISPYLFFWQTTMEAEDVKKKALIIIDKRILTAMRKDIDLGMFFSNAVMYFIILSCGTVLFGNGINKIDTVEQAAAALKPIAGNAASLLFAAGIIGTGFLAIPVLSGSLSYMFAETFEWQEGFDKQFFEAKPFYVVITISLIIGLLINFAGLSPVKALLYSAILYGLTAPVVIIIILHISNNKTIMGKETNSIISNILGITTLIIMTVAAIALLYSQLTD